MIQAIRSGELLPGVHGTEDTTVIVEENTIQVHSFNSPESSQWEVQIKVEICFVFKILRMVMPGSIGPVKSPELSACVSPHLKFER